MPLRQAQLSARGRASGKAHERRHPSRLVLTLVVVKKHMVSNSTSREAKFLNSIETPESRVYTSVLISQDKVLLAYARNHKHPCTDHRSIVLYNKEISAARVTHTVHTLKSGPCLLNAVRPD